MVVIIVVVVIVDIMWVDIGVGIAISSTKGTIIRYALGGITIKSAIHGWRTDESIAGFGYVCSALACWIHSTFVSSAIRAGIFSHDTGF